MQQRAPYLVLPGRAAVPSSVKQGHQQESQDLRVSHITCCSLQGHVLASSWDHCSVSKRRERGKKNERSQKLIGMSIENMVRISLQQKKSSTLQYCFNIFYTMKVLCMFSLPFRNWPSGAIFEISLSFSVLKIPKWKIRKRFSVPMYRKLCLG